MILIVTNNESNTNVDLVMDWIDILGGTFKRINGSDFLNGNMDVSYSCKNNCFKNTSFSESVNFDNVGALWYRGFVRDREYFNNFACELKSNNDNISELRVRTKLETARLFEIFLSTVHCETLPSKKAFELTKIGVLDTARKVGLKIPDYIVTNSKKKLLNFYFENDEAIITKSLYETVYFVDDEASYHYKTNLISLSYIESCEESFYPSFFQKYIEKSIELRIFILGEEIYPMSIFSQLDTQTTVDFRNYNQENPNRTVPFELPKSIEQKLIGLMKSLGLNTGSIDMIKTPDGEYLFLEVNPNGQFGMTSHPCNYNLEKKIAQYLISIDEKQ